MNCFIVLDNGKPAQTRFHKVDRSWNNCLFTTFEDAERYAISWLGVYNPSFGTLELNVPYDYSGYGDMIEIKELFELEEG